MFHEPRSTFALLVDGVRPGGDIAPGLGFVGSALFVDQHVLARGRFARMIPAMRTAGYRVGLGIDENTAAIVAPDGRITIAGRSGAVLIDLAAAHDTTVAGPVRIAGVRIGLLRPGDAYDPTSGAVTASSRERPESRFGPASVRSSNVEDVLGRNVLSDVLSTLADPGMLEVVGTAAPPGMPEHPSVRFRFRKTERSRVFGDEAAGRGVTVLGIDLDIAPIEP